MQDDEGTCGQELAASAEVPAELAALFRHVAANLRDHAAWVGTEGADAAREHEAMIRVAEGYEAISATAERTAETMRALSSLPPAPHDPERMDRHKFAAWMKQKIELQRKVARTLLEHVEQSERVLEQLDAASSHD